MSAGPGFVLLLAGAVLFWALEADLPYVAEAPLGVILMVSGVLAVAASTVVRTYRARSGVSGGIVLFAAGAVLAFAVDLDLPFVLEDALGVVLMIGGLVAVVAAGAMELQASRREDPTASWPPRGDRSQTIRRY